MPPHRFSCACRPVSSAAYSIRPAPRSYASSLSRWRAGVPPRCALTTPYNFTWTVWAHSRRRVRLVPATRARTPRRNGVEAQLRHTSCATEPASHSPLALLRGEIGALQRPLAPQRTHMWLHLGRPHMELSMRKLSTGGRSHQAPSPPAAERADQRPARPFRQRVGACYQRYGLQK